MIKISHNLLIRAGQANTVGGWVISGKARLYHLRVGKARCASSMPPTEMLWQTPSLCPACLFWWKCLLCRCQHEQRTIETSEAAVLIYTTALDLL